MLKRYALILHQGALGDFVVTWPMLMGLSRAFAERAAKSLLCNATQLFAGEQGSPAAIVQEMIDYRGMIAAALQTMMDKGFMESVSAGLEAAMARS